MAKTKEKGQKTSNYRYLQNTTQKTKDSEIFQERFEDIKNEIRNVDQAFLEIFPNLQFSA
jgi:cation transport regulator ChaC